MSALARLLVAVLAVAVAAPVAATAAPEPRAPVGDWAPRGAVQRIGPWLVDDQGRVVVAHGWNVVRKVHPFVRREFGDADVRLLAAEGFTVARIGLVWEAVEPEPGRYDDAYIARVLRLDALLERYGIRSLVDFHQDLWGRVSHGDGAPAWATASPNLNLAFAAFWRDEPAADGVGVQTHFVRAWQYVARALRRRRNILGLDPFNEPYPGSDYPAPSGPFTRCPEFERGALDAFHRRVIEAIRAAGAPQIVFPEGVAESGEASPVLPLTADPQIAFNFHYYCPRTQLSALDVAVGDPSPEAAACAAIERRNLARFTGYAAENGVPGFLSEFSCNDVNPDNAQIVDLIAQTFTSWTAWAYYTAADDPADCPGQGLLVDDRTPASTSNAKQRKLDALAVPYAAAIAGTPEGTSLDRASRTYRLSFRSSPVPGAALRRGAATAIFIPARMYPTGYAVAASGGRVRSRANARWLLVDALPDRAVSVTVTPR